MADLFDMNLDDTEKNVMLSAVSREIKKSIMEMISLVVSLDIMSDFSEDRSESILEAIKTRSLEEASSEIVISTGISNEIRSIIIDYINELRESVNSARRAKNESKENKGEQ